MFLKFKIFLVSFIILISKLFASVQLDTSLINVPNSTSLVTNYNKILNLHNFSSSLSSLYELKNFTFMMNNRFNSNIIFSTIKSIRDENYFDLKGQYKIVNLFQPAISIESKRINDNRKIGISRFKDFAIKGLIVSNPFASFKISPSLVTKKKNNLRLMKKEKLLV